MKRFLTFFTCILLSGFVLAQKGEEKKHHVHHPDSRSKSMWHKGGTVALYIGQAGSKNWASGTEPFSLSANAFLTAFANKSFGNGYWNSMITASYGLINNKDQGVRKNDDKVDFYSTLGFHTKNLKHIGFGAAFNFRSQFSSGYDYDYLNQGLIRRTSGFFAPAIITIAPMGIQWNPKHFTIYASPVAFRGIIVSNAPYSFKYQGGTVPTGLVNEKNISTQERSVADMYGVDPHKTIRFEFGAYLSANYDHEICKNVTLTGRLDAFSDFTHSHPENIDLFWTNTFNLKVNRWLSAAYSIDLAYDDNTRKFGYFRDKPGTQVKSILGLGVNARLSHKKR